MNDGLARRRIAANNARVRLLQGDDGMQRNLIYRIGEVSQRTGISVEALRYYERLGLLPKPKRTEGGARRYEPHVVDRVSFIKQAQGLGLTLQEIHSLLGDPERRSRAGCRRVYDLVTRHINEVNRRIVGLRQLRRMLDTHRRACAEALRREPEPPCPTLDSLERRA